MPPIEQDDDTERDNDGALIAGARAKIAASKSPEAVDEVDLDADEDDEDPVDAPVVSRDGKRKNRFKEAKEEARKAREEAEAVRKELAETRTRQAHMEGYLQAQTRPAQKDPLEERSEALEAEERQLVNHWRVVAPKATAAEVAEFEQRALNLKKRQEQVVEERIMRRIQPNGPANPVAQFLANRYPDVFQNPKAMIYADNLYKAAVAAGDAVEGLEAADHYVEEARKKFKIGSRYQGTRPRTPDPSMRTKLAGQSSGASGAGGEERNVVKMGPMEKRMAIAQYSGRKDEKGRPLSEEQMHVLWAKTTGKRMLEKSRAKAQ